MRLSPQAKEILEQLKQHSELTVEDLEDEGYDQSMVNRAAIELEEKELIEVEKDEILGYDLTEEGEKIIEKGSPEYQLVEKVRKGENRFSELQDIDLDLALGKARDKNLVEINQGVVELTEIGEEYEDETKKRLEEDDFTNEDEERGLVRADITTRRELLITEKGSETDLDEIEEDFNVKARTKTPRTGKKHYYREIISYARQTWLEMGFQEMKGNYIVPGLLNFDALYTPQDHPARELHDTFFVERPGKSDLSEYGDKVNHIKQTHEDGWETGSHGFGYDWNKEEAKKNLLRTHTTAISAQRLHQIDINEEELPKKFFIIGRNFRNETVDRTHLAEFYQTDGIVVGKNLNFANLKGYISEFFEKMGYDEFRLIPAYYPYTEMSVEVQVWDEEDEEWLGMGGAGMFRPEVVKPMLGFEAKVLAWGLGIPRIAFKAAGLSDIRELYRNDINTINETPVWRPEVEK
ncbi:MAG: phenylalanine--tRNA ligase subunit alpha [Nanohaloarchaea archaeon SW_7_43_1]|nr:MAG: phenylalanine--tRNA ligase subunit alpha [Nanohaloarchaea archaeon SW_7_43_1]